MSDDALKRLAAFAVIVVASVAAVVSYAHIYALALHLGQPRPLAVLMPLSVDGAVGQPLPRCCLLPGRLGTRHRGSPS